MNTYPIRRAVEYYIPKWWLKINPPRQLSDEQRAAMAENARKRFLTKNTQAITGEQEQAAAAKDNYISQSLDGEKSSGMKSRGD